MSSPSAVWTPHPGAQTNFLANPAYEVLYGGARGGGKTDCLLFGALRQVAHPQYRALILRRTFPELREVMDRAHEAFGRMGSEWVASEKRWRFPSGATVEFGYCESFADAMQYQGQEFHYLAFDEIGQLPDERTWVFLMTNQRRKTKELQVFARCSANPGGPGHGWLKRRFVTPCPWDGSAVYDEHGNTKAYVPATVYDNPTLIENDPEYVKKLEALPGVMREQFLLGNWDAGDGLAFAGLTEHSHRAVGPMVTPQYFGAFDWGYGHKWAFVLFAVLPGGRVRVVDSVMGRRHTPDAIVERVRELLGQRNLGFSDLRYTVAGSDVKIKEEARGNYGPSVLEQFIVQGWPLMSADQSRVAGYQNALMYLGNKLVEFELTPGNRIGIGQLMELTTDPDFPNDVLKVDADPITGEGGDDWYDAWRYGLMSRPLLQQQGKRAVTGAKSPNRHLPWEERAGRSPERFALPAVALPGTGSIFGKNPNVSGESV